MNPSHDFIKRLIAKEHGAFMEVFDVHYRTLHAIAVNYLADSDAADDMVQEMLIYLYENSHKLRDVENMGGFLRVVMRRRCLNYLRRLQVDDKNKTLYRKELEIIGNLELIEESEVDTNIRMAQINAIIDTLPESCREICRLRFEHNYKVDHIAELLSLSPGTVKAQLNRARTKIKRGLGENALLDGHEMDLLVIAALIIAGL